MNNKCDIGTYKDEAIKQSLDILYNICMYNIYHTKLCEYVNKQDFNNAAKVREIELKYAKLIPSFSKVKQILKIARS